jgi:hypothetical protein
VEQQRDSEDSIDKSLSSLFDAIVNIVSLLYARVERLILILNGLGYREVGHSIAAGPIELGCCVYGGTH